MYMYRSALLCEWESHPDNIVYHHPYVIAFDQRFIEIRHVETVSMRKNDDGMNVVVDT